MLQFKRFSRLTYNLPVRDLPQLGISRSSNFAFCLFATLATIGANPLFAQDVESPDPHPLKTADTSSPRATLTSFLETFDEVHRRFYGEGRRFRSDATRRALSARATRCLDLRDVPESVRYNVGREAAVCLKEVLDRIELPPEDDWPDAEQVATEELTRWTIPDTEITIARVNEGPHEGEFLFTPATVERAVDFYTIVKDLPYQDKEMVTPYMIQFYLAEPGWMLPRPWIRALPSWARARWFGQAVWQWVALILTLVAALGLMLTIYVFGRRRAHVFRSNVMRYLITIAFPVAAMLVPLAAVYFIGEQIRVSGTVLLVVGFSLRLVFFFALIVVLLGAGNRIAALVIATPWIQPRGLDAQFVRLVSRVASIVAAIIVFLEGGQRFGIPLSTLLASAGVGGLAVALAAQDTLKNVFGSVMITLDKPYRVGERIVTKGYDGLVEEIGLRSTKIRLLNGHQASIPNEEMARSDIENIGRRPYIRRAATIEMPSFTPVAKINRALEIVRDALQDHEGMKEDFPPRVYLRDINPASIGILVIYWYHPPDYWEYLAFSEKLNLQLMQQFEAEHIPFAKRTLTVEMSDTGKQGVAQGESDEV
ncbi:Low conductance mechanosensitive channel YnaI [Symmachiella macrocystis]|uniref:Low conductance mechanosensitive channel YnaI n=1 Tax=Symmachiella macrocystis TaxID=2527985 RepID=A0A5C6BT11_9PLAN|nr:mechanosensitive ion channel family protein [Symmachiella macrocystis]TWU14581.1 Low conductance mechanosensitive channel YnaI [Symmachiella macrocystis]